MWPFGTASHEKFAKMVIRRRRRHGYAGPLEYDRDEFALKSDQGTWFLGKGG